MNAIPSESTLNLQFITLEVLVALHNNAELQQRRHWSDLGRSGHRCQISPIVELKLNTMLVKFMQTHWSDSGTQVMFSNSSHNGMETE